MNIINAEVAFLVMLGSAIWTSLQLAQRSHHARAGESTAAGVTTATEGLICALVWFATVALASGESMIVTLAESVIVGIIWAGFGYVARLPFASRSHARVN